MKANTILALIFAATTALSLLSFPAKACEDCDKGDHVHDNNHVHDEKEEQHEDGHDEHKDHDDHDDTDHKHEEKSEAKQ